MSKPIPMGEIGEILNRIKLDIIYVNFNSTDYLLTSIESLLMSNVNHFDLNIMVVDNASTDGVDRIARRFPDVKLTLNIHNIGFGAAINSALNTCHAPYAVLLNPDSLIISSFFLTIVNYMQTFTDVGIVGPMILDESGSIQGSARAFPTPLTSLFGRNSPLTKLFPNNSITRSNILTWRNFNNQPMEVDWVSGACMVVRREAIEAIGGFDERFFLYWEDTDLCHRMQDAGWKVIYYPNVKITHLVGKSSNTRPIFANYQFHKSCFLLFEKYTKWPMSLFTPIAGILLMLRFVVAVMFNYIHPLFNRSIFEIKKRPISMLKRQNEVKMKGQQLPSKKDKLRVLHLITRLIVGGAQENTIYTAEMLDKDRYDVDVISGPQTGPEGSLIASAIDKNVNLTIENKLVRELSPIKDLIAFFKLIRHIRSNGYDIVHTHSSKAGIVGRWASWIAGVPTIVHTVHGWGFHAFQHPMLRLFYIFAERVTLLITDRLIAVTVKDIEKGIRAGIGKRQDYQLIRSGIDLNRFTIATDSFKSEIRAHIGIPQDAKVIGTVTRLSPQKAPHIFIEAASLVHKMDPDVYFVIVGDGPLRKTLEKQANDLGIADRTFFTGIRYDVHKFYHVFDLFILTSLWEGLPRVIPQAMASGIPVIASKVDGNAEIIRNNVSGVLVDPENAKEFAEAAVDLINDSGRSEMLRRNALKSVNEYSVQKMVSKIDRLYRGLKSKRDH